MKPWFSSLILVLLLIGCGGGKKSETETATPPPAATTGGLTAAELANGIGPIKSLSLDPLNTTLAKSGQEIFDVKCISCHKLDERYVGPALKGVTQRRTPEFIMNQILNPAEMIEKHPVTKELLAQYYIPMTFQNVTEADARAILEYFRSVDAL